MTARVLVVDDILSNVKLLEAKLTAEYFDSVWWRITAIGALYLAMVCLVPEILITCVAMPFYFGAVSLLIVVNVTMDTVAQIQGHLRSPRA